MMRKFLLFVTLILSGLTLQGQTAQEFKSVTDTLRARLHRRTSVDASLKLNRVMKRGTTLNFIFSKIKAWLSCCGNCAGINCHTH